LRQLTETIFKIVRNGIEKGEAIDLFDELRIEERKLGT
jgi:hypothetical protein